MGLFDIFKKRENQSASNTNANNGTELYSNAQYMLKYGVVCPKDLRTNLSLSQFRFVRAIGNGHAAMIFEAEHIPSKTRCVLKICMKTRLHPEEVKRMQREIAIHAAVQHPYILNLYAAFEDIHAYYLVLEHASNGDLLYFLRKQPSHKMPVQHAVFLIIHPLLQAIDFLHQKQIIHRDIKPENILIDGNGDIRLCDFGMAIDSSKERPHTVLGTLEYMAPELLLDHGAPFTNKLDTWAIGVLLYECIVGHSPFFERKEKDIMKKIMQVEYDITPITSANIRNFIQACLVKEPLERWSAAELLHHPLFVKDSEDNVHQVRRSISYS